MNKDRFTKQIKASSKLIECDLVIKNISIVDVFNKNTYVDSVAIKDGYIVGIGNYDAPTIIDGTSKYICPGLIDAHCHIESSLVTPKEYSKAALLNGVTSVIADPHEIGNVLGTYGLDFMIESSKNLPFDLYYMLPSCVPGTDFESSGATLLAKDLNPYYSYENVLGLAEVMNFPGVASANEDMVDKLYDAKIKGKTIDGHGAGFNSMMLNSYATANITTDHECTTYLDALERTKRGMYVLMREGTVAKNLTNLLPAVNEYNSSRFCLCTDDKHVDDMINTGSINSSVVTCINYGLRPETSISLATLNTATLYKLSNKGAIAPGYVADFLILDSLKDFKINSVFKNGSLVVKDNNLVDGIYSRCEEVSINITNNSVNIPNINEDSFNIKFPEDKTKKLNVIELIPNKLESIHLKVDIDDINDCDNLFTKGYSKIAVVERHKASGNIGLGILKGMEIQNGAIATTIAHDSHNLIVSGSNDKDMLFACRELEKLHGGIIVVQDEKVLASIKLEIGGLMTNRSYTEIEGDLTSLHKAINIIAPGITFNPFLTLSFLPLPVIPELKITDKGLFDVTNFKFIDLFE